MAVQFFFNEVTTKLFERRKLKAFIETLFMEEGYSLNYLSYIFCSDQYLLSINKEFLQHDNYTDIITFCLSDSSDPVEGEIYISIERIIENSRLNRVPFQIELHRVIFHGALHLCGYLDKKPSDKKLMTKAEDRWLQIYFG